MPANRQPYFHFPPKYMVTSVGGKVHVCLRHSPTRVIVDDLEVALNDEVFAGLSGTYPDVVCLGGSFTLPDELIPCSYAVIDAYGAKVSMGFNGVTFIDDGALRTDVKILGGLWDGVHTSYASSFLALSRAGVDQQNWEIRDAKITEFGGATIGTVVDLSGTLIATVHNCRLYSNVPSDATILVECGDATLTGNILSVNTGISDVLVCGSTNKLIGNYCGSAVAWNLAVRGYSESNLFIGNHFRDSLQNNVEFYDSGANYCYGNVISGGSVGNGVAKSANDTYFNVNFAGNSYDNIVSGVKFDNSNAGNKVKYCVECSVTSTTNLITGSILRGYVTAATHDGSGTNVFAHNLP